MARSSYLVTGGTGFIGSALVKALVRRGARVRSLDNDSRGSQHRLGAVARDVEFVVGDMRDPEVVARAVKGVECVCHLAYVNGTEFFYTMPEVVLEVAVKGIFNVIEACVKHGVPELVLASSSEVYQTPPVIPTPEDVPLSVPDPRNPRYSYGGGKILSELLAINYGRRHFQRTTIFRPHNVYGADMGWEHVIPQFVVRTRALCQEVSGRIRLPIQGSGGETRAFIHVDDMIGGALLVMDAGENLGIYNVGTQDEISVESLAKEVGRWYGREVDVAPGVLQPGGTTRRCPDTTKLRALGFEPKISLREGLDGTIRWYDEVLKGRHD
jgi:nucleoside-diphosphate-sugar epimerase